MGVGIGSGSHRVSTGEPVRVSDLIRTIVRGADDAFFGRIEGELKAEGVLVAGNGKYVDRVYRELVEGGFIAIFREEGGLLPNLNLYRIDVDDLFDKYDKGAGLIED
jgi:hypothetical protein